MVSKGTIRKVLTGGAVVLVVLGAVTGGAISERLFGYKILDKWWPRTGDGGSSGENNLKVVSEESVVVEVAEKVSPSVVTINISTTQKVLSPGSFSPSDFFGQQVGGKVEEETVEEDIGSGFVITDDGLVVTNKHVVDDTQAKYKVITNEDKTYEVQKIYRDPVNDLAILKIDLPSNDPDLKPVQLGDSSKLKVGQFVVAIGTALGEFRHTVTTGVVSGLGRGIAAGNPLQGAVEQLDGVIQTDAAINPGNSGGPLINSSGQVIGVNTAVSTQGQNIGFAIPINVIKEAIDNFNKTGQFSRPWLGVRYRLISPDTALQYEEIVPGAYVQEVIAGSPADKAGMKQGDIITKLGGKKISGDDEGMLAREIGAHKVGETVRAEVYREGKTMEIQITLEEAE